MFRAALAVDARSWTASARPAVGLGLVALLCVVLSGCAGMASQQIAGNLSRAILNQDDPETVRAGAPAYLLMLDGMIEDRPDDRSLLMAGARLYGAYAGGLVRDPERARRLSTKARAYGSRALCGDQAQVCATEQQPFEAFAAAVADVGASDLEPLYVYGTSWAGWIQQRSDDWGAVAELPRVEAVLERVVALDPGHDRGRAQLYLGVMQSQVPPAMGGKPENGKAHFELALQYSDGRDLMAKVELARHYARLVFDQKLHDRLLNEVLAADPVEPGLTLSNVLAQEQARRLLADEYF